MLISAFLIGLLGSLHCVGMCGPLAILANRMSARQPLKSILLYHLGRIGVYGILGLIFGTIGQIALLSGMQKWLSVTLGVGIILLGLSLYIRPQVNHYLTGKMSFIFKLTGGQNRSNSNLKGALLLGLVNGLLPCGLVYLALAGAVVQLNLFTSFTFMITFGLGTIPLMLVLGLSGDTLLSKIRVHYRQVLSFGLLAFGAFLIYRGLGMEFITNLKEVISPTAGISGCK